MKLSSMSRKKSRSISYSQLEKAAEVLKIISHPVRLEILEVLEAEEPLSVSVISQYIRSEVEQSMLSHHLIKMKDKGVLTSNKKGKAMYYSLADRHILSIFDCMSKCDFFK